MRTRNHRPVICLPGLCSSQCKTEPFVHSHLALGHCLGGQLVAEGQKEQVSEKREVHRQKDTSAGAQRVPATTWGTPITPLLPIS
jgi:hypothetical protein